MGSFTLALGAVGMEHGHGVVILLEQAGHVVGAVLGAAEDDDGFVVNFVEEGEGEVEFLALSHGVDDVFNRFGGRAARDRLGQRP